MKDLTLVVPCYNEEKIFVQSVERILDLLRLSRLDFELLLIDDKSADKTAAFIRKAAAADHRIVPFFHERNRGRGATVTEGIRKAAGRVVGYIDLDLEISESNILTHYLAIREGYDVVYADRITPVSLAVHPRTLLHFLYIAFTSFFLNHSFGDTNAGCKFFRTEKIRPILQTVADEHWFWDTEILYRARRAGLRIKRLPVLYIRNKNKKSTVKIFSDTVYFFRKVLQFLIQEEGEGKLSHFFLTSEQSGVMMLSVQLGASG